MYSGSLSRAAGLAAFLLLASTAAVVHSQTAAAVGGVSKSNSSAIHAAPAQRPPDIVAQLTERLKASPDDWQTQNKLAVEYVKLGENDRALILLDSAAGLSPQNARIYYNLAVVYERLGRLAEAMESIEHSLKLEADVPGAQRMACDLRLELGKYDESAKCYGELMRGASDDDQLYASYAYALAYAGDIKLALKQVDEGLSKYPGNSKIVNSRGIANFMKRDYGRAAADFAEALKLDPSSSKVRLNLAIAELMNNNRTAALDQYERLRQSDPVSAQQLRDALDRKYLVGVDYQQKVKTALK